MRKSFFLAGAATVVILAGCKASQPGEFESQVVQAVKQKVTIGGKDWQNPVAATPENIREGARHFQHHCQICHGMDGQNTGVPFAARMDPPVANLADEHVQNYADGQLKWIIENGIAPSGMPGWKGLLTDEEMWKMVHFIRNLPPKGSAGIPEVYQEEAEQHTHAPGSKPHKH